MKIEIELPDWVDKDKTLMLLSGQELVAFKYPKGEWKVKEVRCDQCGECCHDTPEGHTPFGSTDNVCNALEFRDGKFYCTAGPNRPHRCLPDPLEGVYNCSIKYR